jgi:hypothetical protein
VGGKLQSPQWHSAIILDSPGPLPLTATGFVTHGGTVQLSFSGSSFTANTGVLSTIKFTLDGQVLSEDWNMFLNTALTHEAFPTKVIMPSLSAGIHTLSLDFTDAGVASGLRTNSGDFFQVVLTELPF